MVCFLLIIFDGMFGDFYEIRYMLRLPCSSPPKQARKFRLFIFMIRQIELFGVGRSTQGVD